MIFRYEYLKIWRIGIRVFWFRENSIRDFEFGILIRNPSKKFYLNNSPQARYLLSYGHKSEDYSISTDFAALAPFDFSIKTAIIPTPLCRKREISPIYSPSRRQMLAKPFWPSCAKNESVTPIWPKHDVMLMPLCWRKKNQKWCSLLCLQKAETCAEWQRVNGGAEQKKKNTTNSIKLYESGL